MPLKRALVLLVILVLAVGTVPAGIVANGRLERALRDRVRESLSMAPELLESRWAATVDVRMMHSRDLARTPGLAEALRDGDSARAVRIVEQVGAIFPEAPVLLGPAGSSLIRADTVPDSLIEATRRGEMPVEAVTDSAVVRVLSLAPVMAGGLWVGAVGGTSVLDDAEAVTLAGLTRSQVLILDGKGRVAGSSLARGEALELARAVKTDASGIHEVQAGGAGYLALTEPLSSSRVIFLKNLEQELAVLPLLQRIALWSGGITLFLALFLGTVFAARLARPVGSLADAAERLAAGDFEAALEPSGIEEVSRMSEAFDQMRGALRTRLAELEEANRELEDRQERLMVLQGELVQRDRLASAGRLLAQLAHEIRNPIASIRNCLEVVHRRTSGDPEARRFADMAIDELLRMHELTEQMLDVHRPRDPEGTACEVSEVAREVAPLLRAGGEPGKGLNVSVVSPGKVRARVAPDSLKQVLLNLGSNAREAMRGEGTIEILIFPPPDDARDRRVRIEVLDRGPGVAEEVLPRIFDPFFTTKTQMHGVGLGLFTAEALVRTYGGRIGAANRADGPGARFTVEFPEASDDD